MPMNRIPVAAGVAALLLLLSASAKAADLGVEFKWSSSDRCSHSSPEIHVSNVPEGTKSFKVRLKDLDVPNYRHGGGTVTADPSGVIPQGALTDGYNGPCPPEGTHHYRFTVTALDNNGDALAKGSADQPFP